MAAVTIMYQKAPAPAPVQRQVKGGDRKTKKMKGHNYEIILRSFHVHNITTFSKDYSKEFRKHAFQSLYHHIFSLQNIQNSTVTFINCTRL